MPTLGMLARQFMPQMGAVANGGFDPSVLPPQALASLVAAAAPSLGGLAPSAPRTLGDVAAPTSPAGQPNQYPAPYYPQGQGAAPFGSRAGASTLGDLMSRPANVDQFGQFSPQQSLGDIVGLGPQAKIPDHKGLFPGKDWKTLLPMVLGAIGDGLTAYGGGQPIFGPMMVKKNLDEQQHRYDLERITAEEDAKRKALFAPHPEQVGNTVGIFDPSNHSYDPIYTSPSAPEQYASALGAQPGTPEYQSAVQDYILRANSDPAVANRIALDNARTGNRQTLQDDRLAVTKRGQDLSYKGRLASIAQSNTNNLRSTNVSHGNNVRTTGTSQANNVLTNNTRLRTARHMRGDPVLVNTPEEARALPPGTLFMTPDGRVKQR